VVLQKVDGVQIYDDKNKRVFLNTRVVESTNVEWVGWPESGEPIMFVRYSSGKLYGYLGVSRQRTVAAAYSSSVGSYIAQRVKPKFRVVQIS
jgi:hypothetical protein